MPNVYTGGTFDLFHPGHISFLQRCARLAGPDGKVMVSLNPDEFVAQFKGAAPIMSFDERKIMLEECQYVDKVVRHDGGYDIKPTIAALKDIDIIAVGSDWACKDYFAQTSLTDAWLRSRNIMLVYLPYTDGISTTELRARVLASGERVV